jgi:hypothetical protein
VVVVVLALLMELPRMTGVPAAVLLIMRTRAGAVRLFNLEQTAMLKISVMMAGQQAIMRWALVEEALRSKENRMLEEITGVGMAEME